VSPSMREHAAPPWKGNCSPLTKSRRTRRQRVGTGEGSRDGDLRIAAVARHASLAILSLWETGAGVEGGIGQKNGGEVVINMARCSKRETKDELLKTISSQIVSKLEGERPGD